VLVATKNQQLKFKFTFLPDARESVVNTTVTKDINFRQILNGKATITTATDHGFQIGQPVTLAEVNEIFNGTHTIDELPSATTFVFRTVESNIPVSVSTGTAVVQLSKLNGGLSYDPIALGSDVVVQVYRGQDETGSLVVPPISYRHGGKDISPNAYIERNGTKEFIFNFTITENFEGKSSLFAGVYTVLARTSINGNSLTAKSQFEVKDNLNISQGDKSTVINYKPSYQELNRVNMQSILLIGHADGIELNNPVRINSVQNAINLLSGNKKSPLLRGVLDAYGAGARNIYICAAAPMNEYVENVEDRNNSFFAWSDTVAQTFYEKYYQRLKETYSIIKELDDIDIVVPLEVSFIKTNEVDFLSQLVHYCNDYHNSSGSIQIGIIGSRSNGISTSDIEVLKLNKYLKYKYTTFTDNNTQIGSDIGRYVFPIYGEALFSHLQIEATYNNSVSAAVAGMVATSSLNIGLTRKRIPGALSLYGTDLNSSQLNELDLIGINTIYRGVKARRGDIYQVYLASDYTLSNLNSVFSKLPQMRLVSYVSSQIKSYGYDYLGKFGYDKIVTTVTQMLQLLKSKNIIVDFEFKAEQSAVEKGTVFFYINLTSSLGLKKINLSLAAGPGA